MSNSLEDYEQAHIKPNDVGIYGTIDVHNLQVEDFEKKEIYINANNLDSEFIQQRYFLELEKQAEKLKCKTVFKKILASLKHEIIKPSATDSCKENMTNFTGAPIQLKCGKWTCNDSGVYRESGRSFLEVAQHPVLVSKRIKDVEYNNEKLIISFKRDEKWQDVIMPKSIIADKKEAVKLLAENGACINSSDANNFEKYINELLMLNKDIPIQKGISHLGWYEDKFMPYNNETLAFSGDDNYKNIFDYTKPRGDLQKWVNATMKIINNKNVRQILAVSFASPLIEYLGGQPFLCHVWGKSGCGKTVGMLLALSIWGKPEEISLSTKTTQTALERYLATLKNIPLGTDELQLIVDAYGNFDTFIMSVCEGKGKARANVKSIEKVLTWKNAIIVTGEQPILTENSFGGAYNRTIEFSNSSEEPIVPNDKETVDTGNFIIETIKENYGVAGYRFIQEVKRIGKEKLLEDLKEIKRKVASELKITGKQTDIVARNILAFNVANKVLFGVEDLTPADYSSTAKNDDEMATTYRAYNIILDWISKCSRNFITKATNVLNDIDGEHFMMNNECYGIIEDNTAYINPTELRKILKYNNFSFDAIKEELWKKGLIERQNPKEYTCQKWFMGRKNRCIKIILPTNTD